jgi:hypothetical protein
LARRPKLSHELRASVRERAGGLCEYCHASEAWQYVEFTIDHVVPIAAMGTSGFSNLALVCFACNRRKWDRRAGTDPETAISHRLFDPRADPWNEHFAWAVHGLEIVGTSSIGRATVEALDLNRERLKQIRAADLARSPWLFAYTLSTTSFGEAILSA